MSNYNITNNNGILEISENPDYKPDSKGYGAICFEKMKEFSSNIAQITIETNETQTYGEILQDSIRCALEMHSLGIRENDIISFCTHTHAQTCIPYLATAFSGAIMASLDPTLSQNDMIFLSGLIRPKLIFCIPESVEYLEKAIEENKLDCKLVVFGETEKHLPFKTFLKPQNDEEDFKPKIAENLFDTVGIFFSSGTTGLPKAICLTHYGILYVLNLLMDFYNFKSALFVTTPYWISYILIATSTLLSGGKRILTRNFNPTKIVQQIQDYKVTYLFLPPSMTYPVCNHADNYNYDTSSLYTMMLGGSTTSAEQVTKIQKLFPKTIINQVYGLTEVCAFFSMFHLRKDIDLIRTKLGSSGRMLPGTTCKLVDIETNKVVNEPYKRGELLIKSKRLFKEYYNNEKATREVFDSEGFLYTGDIVYYDEDYCFYIVDRIKEMFKYKSWQIAPAELEAILLKHPKVKEAIIIGYPNEEDGDHPMAVVIPKDDVETSEAEILNDFNEQVVDRKKLRGGLKFVENLPKTTTGKYSRRVLRNMVINNQI